MDCPSCAADASAWACCPRSGRTFHRCPSCGLVFLDPALRLSRVAERERYLLHRNEPDDPGFRAYLGRFIDAAVAPFVAPGASILDWGSGPEPVLAALLGERGWSVSIWDPFFASSKDGLRPGAFEAISLHEVIEHCADPLGSLREASSYLAPGGVICLSTLFRPPSPGAFLSWWYREDPTHLSFLDPPCLARHAHDAGLSLVSCDMKAIAVLRKS